MAKARHLSTLVLAVMVLSCCIVCAYCDVTGTILSVTLMQGDPGAASTVLTTLFTSDVVTVICRTENALVYDDPWWLQVNYAYVSPGSTTATTITGWVADYDVDCGNVGNCIVPQC